MDRPRLIRGLRIAWSVWWGILCVLLVVLWVRSYWSLYAVGVRIPNFGAASATSLQGRIICGRMPESELVAAAGAYAYGSASMKNCQFQAQSIVGREHA